MNYVYLGIFAVITTLHLYASLKNDYDLRSITKGLILMTLLGFYLESVTGGFSWIVVIALLTSWLGDMFLIGKGVKWFTVGGIFFMISHMFFIWAYSSDIVFNKVPVALIVGLGLLFTVTVSIIFKNLRPHLLPQLFIPMFFYLLINGTMNCFAIFRMISLGGIGGIVTAIGALLFFISDSTLFFVRFNKECKIKSHFLVMLTYSLGEFLIILGLVM